LQGSDNVKKESGRWLRGLAVGLLLLLAAAAAVSLIAGPVQPLDVAQWLQRTVAPSSGEDEAPAPLPVGLGALTATGDAYGATTWYFAHGIAVPSGDTHHTWLLLANPGTTIARATVHYLLDSGSTQAFAVEVPAQGRLDLYANQRVTGEFSTKVTSDIPLVAEQSVFFANDGYTVAGVATPSTVWYLPEGPTGTYETRLHIHNPGLTSVSLAFTLYSETGQTEVAARTVGPQATLRLPLSDISSLSGSVGVRISADAPVVVQRVSRFPGADGGKGAHASTGASMLNRSLYFPLLMADGNYDSWLLLLNPGDALANVEATYWQGAQKQTVTYSVPAHSRQTVWLDKEAENNRIPSGNLSLVLKGDAPIAAEVVVYDSAYYTGTASIGAPGAAQRWYFAEGSTGRPYTTYLAIFNPGTTGAVVSASLLPAAPVTGALSWALLPGELKVVNVNSLAQNRDTGFSSGFALASDGPLVVQRLMTMEATGLMGTIGLPDQIAPTEPVAFLPLIISPPGPSPTPAPTSTPRPDASPTPQVTPTRVRRAEADSFILGSPIVGTANCGTTGIKGRVTGPSGAPLPGMRVRVWADGWDGGLSNPTDADGRWDFVLGTGPRAGTWFAALADDSGQMLSRAVALPTSDDCSNGHQWLEINWSERGADPPQYVLAWTRRLSCAENNQNHHLFIDVTDAEGRGLAGVNLKVTWAGGETVVTTGNKPEFGPGRVEFAMYKGTYTVTVMNGASDTAHQLTVDLDDETCSNHGNTLFHYSYHVVFRGL